MEKEKVTRQSVNTIRFFAACLFAYMRTLGFNASEEARWLDVLRVVQMDQQANSLLLADLLNGNSSGHANPLDSGSHGDSSSNTHLSTDIALRKEDKHPKEEEDKED